MSSCVAGPSNMNYSLPPSKKRRISKTTHVMGTVQAVDARANLSSLPHDILLIIIGLVGIEDILALRRTSKRFMSVTKLRWVWQDALEREVIQRKIPVPAPVPDFRTLSSQDLESRALHATILERNWTSSNPRPRRIFEYIAGPDTASEPVTHVRFLPGHNGQLVLSVQHSRVVCWEIPLSGEDAFIVAEREVPGGTIANVVINEDKDSLATLVLVWSLPVIEDDFSSLQRPRQNFFIEAWSMDRFHGTFTTLRSDTVAEHMKGRITPLSSLVGDIAMVGDPVAVWNWTRPGTYTALNAVTHASPVPDNLLAVKAVRNYLVVVRQSHLQLLPMPEFGSDGLPRARRVEAGAVYVHLREVASEALIVVHPLPEDQRGKWQFDPITVMLRIVQDGAHAVRTYDILPRPVDAQQDIAPACCSGCGTDREGRQRVVALQLPFHPIPGPSFTYVVPRTCENLTIGPHGRGLWTETRMSHRTSAAWPMRTFVGFDVTCELVHGEWRSSVTVREASLQSTRLNVGEVEFKKPRVLDAALEDTVGRAVVGCRDGRVQVMDFA